MVDVTLVAKRRRVFFEDRDGFRYAINPFHVYVEGEKVVPLLRLSRCVVDNVEIALETKGSRIQRLQVSSRVLSAVWFFLRNCFTEPDLFFDCYSFANLANGVEPNLISDLLKYWEFVRVGEIKADDCVFFFDAKNRTIFLHVAVYIGFGYSLNVLGPGGDLVVMELGDYVKYFEQFYGPIVYSIMRPKKKEARYGVLVE